jgi:RNA polymerase sigma-70 factor (ECF subfamily)
MDDQQERAIARGLREGDSNAWRTLYEAFAERVWRSVARLMPPSSAEVADVVQETFLAAARSARTFDPGKGTLWLWLWGIARRSVALYYRKKEQRDRLHTLAVQFRLPQDLPPDLLVSAELATLVRAALAELPQEYEILLTTRYLQGDSVEQIAQGANCSPTAIRSRLARARRAFREVFHQYVPPFDCPTRTHHEPTG